MKVTHFSLMNKNNTPSVEAQMFCVIDAWPKPKFSHMVRLPKLD
jgi:hypothetical protein